MNTIKLPIAILFGAALATGFILACSDDAPQDADAAVCDCPAAEPPLAGRVVKVESVPVAIPAGSHDAQSATCPAGAVLLGGGCHQEGAQPDFRVLLMEAAPTTTGQGYSCWWQNNNTVEQMAKAVAICLLPPPQ